MGSERIYYSYFRFRKRHTSHRRRYQKKKDQWHRYVGGFCSIRTLSLLGPTRWYRLVQDWQCDFQKAIWLSTSTQASSSNTHFRDSKTCLFHSHKRAAPFLSAEVQRFLFLKKKDWTAPMRLIIQEHATPEIPWEDDRLWMTYRMRSSLKHWHRRLSYCRLCYKYLISLLEQGISPYEAKKRLYQDHAHVIGSKRFWTRGMSFLSRFQKNVFRSLHDWASKQPHTNQTYLIKPTWAFLQSFLTFKKISPYCLYTGYSGDSLDTDHPYGRPYSASTLQSDPIYNRFIKHDRYKWPKYLPDYAKNAQLLWMLRDYVAGWLNQPVELDPNPGAIEQQLLL